MSKQHVSVTRSPAAQTSATRVGLVSVIIPAYNACVTVERTISSVVNQTYSNLEVLVVDDGSTDETALLVQRMADADPRIRLLQKPNGGLVSARNFGIAHASGEFIAPIDADDLWHPEKIAKQVRLPGCFAMFSSGQCVCRSDYTKFRVEWRALGEETLR